MIGKAIREEHTHPRPLNITVEHFFKGYPGFSMLLPKIGCVAAHPANVHRLLCDEEQLVLVFPEGRKGTEKLYKDRYKLRRFGRGGFVEAAMRAKVPIVPVCVVGAEEAAPIFAHMNWLQRLTGLLYAPISPIFPPRAARSFLPAKFKLRFLEPIQFDEHDMWPTSRSSRPSRRRSARGSRRTSGRWSASASRCGSDDLAPRPHHRPVDLLGRPPGAGARAERRIEAIVGVDTETRRSSSSARSSSASAPSTGCCAGSSTPPRSTPSSTAASSSTRPSPPRATRTRTT